MLRSALVTAALAVTCACAHERALHPREAEDLVVDATAFRVEHDAGDCAAAIQVKRALALALPLVERWGHLSERVVVRIHATHEELEAAARKPGYEWLRAWARRGSIELQSPRTWSRGAATDDELVQLLAHELTHCVMFQRMPSGIAARSIPVWFREGMAIVTARERHPKVACDVARVLGLTSRARAAAAPPRPRADLYRDRADAVYAVADRAFRLLLERHGEARVRKLLTALGSGGDFSNAFQASIGLPLDAFEEEIEASYGDDAAGG